MGITEQLSARICGVGFETLDQASIAAMKCLIADGVAVAIAGSAEESSTIVAGYVRDFECAPYASVWGYGYQTSPVFAAYTNAVSMHALDFEPMASPPTHALSPTVPVALALAESGKVDGKDVIAACAKGLEMQVRILSAANHVSEAMPFHTPGVVGALGAAVTASHLLKFDSTLLANALGIAASRSGALRANALSMVKDAHCGNAAAGGLEAALLAQRGFKSTPGILEAQHGYIATFFPNQFDRNILLEFGRPFRCADPGMAIKFYPCEFPTHFGIAAALGLRENVGHPDKIRHIRMVTPEMPENDRPRPVSGSEGKGSFQYTVAAALLDGKVGLNSFANERRFRRDMVEMLEKISVVPDKSVPTGFRAMRVELVITMADGTELRQVCKTPPGFWGKTVSRAQHQAKLRDCLSVRLKSPRLERLLELLDDLEHLSLQETGELLKLLG